MPLVQAVLRCGCVVVFGSARYGLGVTVSDVIEIKSKMCQNLTKLSGIFSQPIFNIVFVLILICDKQRVVHFCLLFR